MKLTINVSPLCINSTYTLHYISLFSIYEKVHLCLLRYLISLSLFVDLHTSDILFCRINAQHDIVSQFLKLYKLIFHGNY